MARATPLVWGAAARPQTAPSAAKVAEAVERQVVAQVVEAEAPLPRLARAALMFLMRALEAARPAMHKWSPWPAAPPERAVGRMWTWRL
ncbi:MAG: hypothetical protein ACREJP_03785 [Candidatus Methylomirabilales bacterium]